MGAQKKEEGKINFFNNYRGHSVMMTMMIMLMVVMMIYLSQYHTIDWLTGWLIDYIVPVEHTKEVMGTVAFWKTADIFMF